MTDATICDASKEFRFASKRGCSLEVVVVCRILGTCLEVWACLPFDLEKSGWPCSVAGFSSKVAETLVSAYTLRN